MKILIVGGTWNSDQGRPSLLVKSFYEALSATEDVTLLNGGNFKGLLEALSLTTQYDVVLWWADVDNNEEKLRDVKSMNPKILLVNSKRNDNNKYSFMELVNRSLEQKANLTVEFVKLDKGFKMMLFDPLGTVWYEGVSAEECAAAMAHRLHFLNSMTRCRSKSVGTKAIAPETDFYEYVRECAEVFHGIINPAKEVTRFLGNSSFRCQRGFPSFRTENGIFVSRRNIDKRFIDKDAFILAFLDENGDTCYFGEDKPSVDTPVQLRLYELFSNINYMVHAHCYVDGGVFTTVPVPCGAIEEVQEISHVTNDFTKNTYAFNLIGHGCIVMGHDINDLRRYTFVARNIPERI